MGKKKETQGLLDQKTRLIGIAAAGHSVGCTHSVSYTHLDVYKRQARM